MKRFVFIKRFFASLEDEKANPFKAQSATTDKDFSITIDVMCYHRSCQNMIVCSLITFWIFTHPETKIIFNFLHTFLLVSQSRSHSQKCYFEPPFLMFWFQQRINKQGNSWSRICTSLLWFFTYYVSHLSSFRQKFKQNKMLRPQSHSDQNIRKFTFPGNHKKNLIK